VTYASWRAIQALRAAPTGTADRDRQRRRTFTAALNQAEELAEAASAVTYAVRPLLLFYSLSQAGRAIAAAHLKAKAELSGHGLSFTCDPIAILKSTVVPPGAQHARGAFQDVATATGSLGLENPAELGALWAGNPDLQHVPVPEIGGEWPSSCPGGGACPQRGPVDPFKCSREPSRVRRRPAPIGVCLSNRSALHSLLMRRSLERPRAPHTTLGWVTN
jgi:hypothetical protein